VGAFFVSKFGIELAWMNIEHAFDILGKRPTAFDFSFVNFYLFPFLMPKIKMKYLKNARIVVVRFQKIETFPRNLEIFNVQQFKFLFMEMGTGLCLFQGSAKMDKILFFWLIRMTKSEMGF
jgi:hypothetical protein